MDKKTRDVRGALRGLTRIRQSDNRTVTMEQRISALSDITKVRFTDKRCVKVEFSHLLGVVDRLQRCDVMELLVHRDVAPPWW